MDKEEKTLSLATHHILPVCVSLSLYLSVSLTPSEQVHTDKTKHRVCNHRNRPMNTTHSSTSFLYLSPFYHCHRSLQYSTWRMGVAVSIWLSYLLPHLCVVPGERQRKKLRGMRTTSIVKWAATPWRKPEDVIDGAKHVCCRSSDSVSSIAVPLGR